MAGRRTAFKIAACEALLKGQSTFTRFGKSANIGDWLTPEEQANPKQSLEALQKLIQQQKPAVSLPKELPPTVPVKDTDYKPDGDICFIIANGESRKNFDLNKIKGKGYIIGMNVLPIFEDFWPDALVSVDIATVKYICSHAKQVPDKLEMWSYPRGGVKDPRVKRLAKDWGWSSGPTSTRIALEYKKFKTIYILGMDFFGITPEGTIDEKNGRKLNNMYKGMDRYRRSNSDRTYFGNWLNQMVSNTSNHPHAKFYHVVLENQKSPNKLAQKNNWIDITYNVFEGHLSKMPKKSS